MKRLLSVLFIAAALVAPAFAAKVTFHASISGAQEVPSSPSPIWGVANLELDPSTGAFKLVVNLKNADETLAASHIHVGVEGVNGSVILGLGGENAYRRVAGKNLHREFTGTIPMARIEALLTNGTYLNFHTATFPGGAARGQLIANPVELTAELSGANEVPARVTPATGVASILFNPGTKQISIHIEVENYANLVTASHIHVGPVNGTGAPTLNLGAESAYVRSGTSLTGNFLQLTYAAAALPLVTGGAYVNLHSSQYPGGEIRGQIMGE